MRLASVASASQIGPASSLPAAINNCAADRPPLYLQRVYSGALLKIVIFDRFGTQTPSLPNRPEPGIYQKNEAIRWSSLSRRTSARLASRNPTSLVAGNLQ